MAEKTDKFFDLDCAAASFNVLFERLDPCGRERLVVSERYRDFLEMLRVYLRKERQDRAGNAPDAAASFCSGEPDTVDALNALAQHCGGRSFGSVSTKEIADGLKAQHGIDIDKKKIVLSEPIKSPGYAEVAVKLHPEVQAKLRVKINEVK